MAGTWVTDLTPGGPYGLVGSPSQVLGLGLPPGQWDWSLSQGSVSRRHWDADTGMPTHWDADTGMPWLVQSQPRRSVIWLKGTGMPWLGCPAARAPTVLEIGAVAVPRWLKVCGLVSCVGWSQLWLGVKTTSRCQNHSYACVCPSCPSKRSRAFGAVHAPFCSSMHALYGK